MEDRKQPTQPINRMRHISTHKGTTDKGFMRQHVQDSFLANDSAMSRVRTSPGPGVPLPLPIRGEKAPVAAGTGVGGRAAVLTLTLGLVLVLVALVVLLLLRSREPPMASNPAPTTFMIAPGRTLSAAANNIENLDLLGGAGVTTAGGTSATFSGACKVASLPHILVSTLVTMFIVSMPRTNRRRHVSATIVVSFLSRYCSMAENNVSSSRSN